MTIKPLALILVLGLLTLLRGYRITTGKEKIIPNYLDMNTLEGQEMSVRIKSFERMVLFPYNIYQYQTKGSFSRFSRSYLFLRSTFQQVQPIISNSNATLYSENEQQIFYQLFPEVILIESEPNQLLELQLLDESLYNKKIVIKNSTLEGQSKISNKIDLNFYSIETHKYLFRIMKEAQYKLHDNQTQQIYNNLLLQKNSTISSIPQQFTKYPIFPDSSFKQFLQKILTNQTLWEDDDFTHVLIQHIVTKTIDNFTKWKAVFDGFSLKYFAASIAKSKTSENLLGHQDSTDNLQMVSLVIRAAEAKRTQTIRQPLSFIKLTSIQFLDICNQGDNVFLLLSDKRYGYVLDITREEWHLLKYIKNHSTEFHSIFFGKQCKVYGLHLEGREIINEGNSTGNNAKREVTYVIQYYPQFQKKLEKGHKFVSFFHLKLDYLILCWETQKCSLYETQNFQQVSLKDGKTFPLLDQKSEVHLRTKISNTTLSTAIEVINYQTSSQQFYQLSSQLLQKEFSLSGLKRTIYASETYFNKTKFASSQMDRLIYQYIKSTDYLHKDKQVQLYDQMFLEINNNSFNCISQDYPSASQTKFQYNLSQSWSVCSFDIKTTIYLSLKISFKELYISGYQLYLCSSYIERYKDRMFIDCSPLLDQKRNKLSNPELTENLRGSHYYKIYMVKQAVRRNQVLPTVYIKDVEKQQIELASAIFFFIMLALSVILIILIIFITMKNIIVNLLIYYGFVNERAQAAYPLSWFAFKTKLKRLKQIGVLKFVQYEPSLNDTEGNHCCFCLQIIREKILVAQIYCGHQFHKQCFNEWIKNQPNARCPTCRRAFTRSGLAQYQSGYGSQQQLPPF